MEASQAADHLIAYSIGHGRPMSNSRVHSLLYYAQAWRLAIYDEKLFSDPIEASENGPVVPDLSFELSRPREGSSNQPSLDSGIQEHLDSVLERYGSLTDEQLARLMKTEAPWIIARGRIPIDGKLLIRDREMKMFYRYGSQDMVTRAAIISCFAYTAITRAFSLNTLTITL